MSPILVRPVREQFEHDRVIRVLQAKYKRKYEVAINPGAEQNAAVGVGDLAMYPDLVLFSQERSRKVQGTVEVETTESINTLEAMAEWGPFSRLRAPFFLYVPASSIDTVRRLCTEHAINPAEIWTYHAAIDQVRFTMVHRSPDAPRGVEPRLKVETEPRKAEEPSAEMPTAERPRAEKPKAEKARPDKPGTEKPRAVKGKADKPRAASRKATAPAARAKAKKAAAPVRKPKPTLAKRTSKAKKAKRK